MATQKQLGQAAGTATATSIYAVPATTEVSNMIMTCCNITATTDKIRIHQDDTAATYSAADALYYDMEIGPYKTIRLAIGPMDTQSGSIGVYCATASSVTFTLHGTERSTA